MNDPMADEAARDMLLNQLLGKQQQHYSEGGLNEQDQGDLAMAIAADPKTKTVVIHFGTSVQWIGMGKKQALQFANSIIEKANEL